MYACTWQTCRIFGFIYGFHQGRFDAQHVERQSNARTWRTPSPLHTINKTKQGKIGAEENKDKSRVATWADTKQDDPQTQQRHTAADANVDFRATPSAPCHAHQISQFGTARRSKHDRETMQIWLRILASPPIDFLFRMGGKMQHIFERTPGHPICLNPVLCPAAPFIHISGASLFVGIEMHYGTNAPPATQQRRARPRSGTLSCPAGLAASISVREHRLLTIKTPIGTCMHASSRWKIAEEWEGRAPDANCKLSDGRRGL